MSGVNGSSRTGVVVLAMVLGLVPIVRDAGAADPVDAVMQSWDVERAIELVIELRGDVDAHDGGCALTLARADLAVASMLRVELEAKPREDRDERRVLGLRIDVHAEEGLDALAQCRDTSERWRIEADLLATMIRSDYRAKKFEKRLKEAIDRALALDESNALAWVASAKPFLFADERHGGDLEEAVRRLGHALELQPGLESALVLRAYAHEQLGRPEAARADLEEVLRLNPECRPARLARSAESTS